MHPIVIFYDRMDEANAKEDVLFVQRRFRASAQRKLVEMEPRYRPTPKAACPEMLMMRVTFGCGVFAAKKPSPSAGCITNHGTTRSAIANTIAEMSVGPEASNKRLIAK